MLLANIARLIDPVCHTIFSKKNIAGSMNVFLNKQVVILQVISSIHQFITSKKKRPEMVILFVHYDNVFPGL